MPARVIPRPHAPLMWVLLPLLMGYGVAEAAGGEIEKYFWPLGLLTIVGFLGALYLWRENKKRGCASAPLLRSKIYFSIGIIALSICYYAIREKRTDIPLDLKAPREASVIIEPRQAFALHPGSGREGGIGIIREAPDARLIGQKINYSVWWDLDTPLDLGSRVRMFGVIAPNKNVNGGFDEFLERMHVPWNLTRGDAKTVVAPAPVFWHTITQLHKGAIAVLHRRWQRPETDSGLLPAIVLGDKAELTPQQKENFVKSGTMHLIAVSGMNVMAVAIVLWVLARITGMPRVGQAAFVVVMLGLYSLVAGAGPSVLRAWGLVSLGLAAWALGRQRNIWSVIILAATVSLILSPLSFLHAGWRMSFGVVSGVVLAMGLFERTRLTHRLRAPWRGIVETLVVSFVAGICVAPMSVSYWAVWQPFGFTINAIAVALATIVTMLGTLSWLVAWIPGASMLVNESAYVLLNVIEGSIYFYLKIPGAYVMLPTAKATGVEVWGTLIVLVVFYILARWGLTSATRRPTVKV